jgi:hypothetical protein
VTVPTAGTVSLNQLAGTTILPLEDIAANEVDHFVQKEGAGQTLSGRNDDLGR